MDGINPTLAFAALFFGLAGHPHDAADGSRQQAYVEQPSTADQAAMDVSPCSEFAVVVQSNDVAQEALERGTAGASIFTDKFGEYGALNVARSSTDGPVQDDESYPTVPEQTALAERSLFDADGPPSAYDVALDAEALEGLRLEGEAEARAASECGYLPPVP
jgi:hypothetical protein